MKTSVVEQIREEYYEQDWKNPKYIFHGTRKLLSLLTPQKAKDSDGNEKNEQTAVYGSSIFEGSVPYAIKEKGKYDCSIGCGPDDLKMKIYSGEIILEDAFGYVYVCDASKFQRCQGTCQFVSYEHVVPLEVIRVFYKDFKDQFIYVDENDEERGRSV